MSPTAISTDDGQQHLLIMAYTVSDSGSCTAVELYCVAGEMYSYNNNSSTATAPAVTAPFYEAALSVIACSPNPELGVGTPPNFGESPSNR